MVLQRDMPIHVWGTAEPGEKVTVTLRKETASGGTGTFREVGTNFATTNPLGHWDVYLMPLKAGGPYALAVTGAIAGEFTIRDVLVGDVWIASGQSNMEFAMRQLESAEKEIAAANIPNIRLLRVHKASSEYPLPFPGIDAPWAKCDSATVREFSAVAYYFGREIQQKENIPVGIIESSWGGTVAEAWTSMQSLTADAALMPVFKARGTMMEYQADMPALITLEKQKQEQAKAEGKPVPKFPWRPRPEMWAPSGLYNAMIAPLIKFPIRGVIWYQGESNSKLDRAFMYERLFQTMIRDWRDRWGEGDFPFLFTQISNFKSDATEDWPTVRDAQRRSLALRNTAMAVTIDIGNPDDVHPTNKSDVGHRLALAARALAYGETLEFSGPLFRQVTHEDHALRIWFDHADGLQTKGTTITGFEVAGADGKFVSAIARIDGTTVIVSSDAVPLPVSVRYGWANSPECNLQNGAGLPASPFRSIE